MQNELLGLRWFLKFAVVQAMAAWSDAGYPIPAKSYDNEADSCAVKPMQDKLRHRYSSYNPLRIGDVISHGGIAEMREQHNENVTASMTQ